MLFKTTILQPLEIAMEYYIERPQLRSSIYKNVHLKLFKSQAILVLSIVR